MLNLLPNLKGCEGKHVTASQTPPASLPSLAPTDSYPAGRVPPSHTLSLLLCLCNDFPTLCLLIPVPLF